jgi:hypothetical protein
VLAASITEGFFTDSREGCGFAAARNGRLGSEKADQKEMEVSVIQVCAMHVSPNLG